MTMIAEEDELEEEALDDIEGEDEEGSEGEGEEAPAKMSAEKKKLIAVIAAVLLLLLVAGGGLYVSGFFDDMIMDAKKAKHAAQLAEEDSPKEEKEKKKTEHGDDHEGGGAFLEIPTMIVNLNSTDGTPRYLRLSVQLELEDPSELADVEAIIPRVVDQFQTYLRELRVTDLRGSAGIYRLQMELLWRVNQAAYPVKIKDVLFQEILIQ